jgi:hypothetical protein
MKPFELLTVLLLAFAPTAQGQDNPSSTTNAASAKSTLATTALIANARAVAGDLKLQAAEQDRIASLKPVEATNAHEIIERALESHTLFLVHINPEMRVKVNPGSAKAELVTGEWTLFLARVENESGTTAPLQISVLSPASIPQPVAWLEAKLVALTNLPVTLSGAPLEYRLVKLRSRESGLREARLSLHVGQGTQDIGFRNEVDILFKCGTTPTSQSLTNPTK